MEQIEGQLSFADFSLDTGNYVVQANCMVSGRQSLELNSAKIVRAAIMQIKPGDEELKEYKLSIAQLSKLLGVSRQYLYQYIDKITDDIISNPIEVRDDGNRNNFIKIPWVKVCAYHKEKGFVIALNDLLKPYLIGLKERYTQYELDCILTMKSTYSIRLFELLVSKKIGKSVRKVSRIKISLNELRESLGCESVYMHVGHFSSRVLMPACKEITLKSPYEVCVLEFEKAGKKYENVLFEIKSRYARVLKNADENFVKLEMET